jgi:hypothetical protein
MSPKELMEERYILENKYPGCNWSVGDIFPANFYDFKPFPYLFRKLEWWEERKAKELPTYVKCNIGRTKEIRRVKKYDFFNRHVEFRSGIGLLENYLPSTKEEYLLQKSQGALID